MEKKARIHSWTILTGLLAFGWVFSPILQSYLWSG